MKMKKEKKITKNHFYLPLIYTKKNNNNFLCSGNRLNSMLHYFAKNYVSRSKLFRFCALLRICVEFFPFLFVGFLKKYSIFSVCSLCVWCVMEKRRRF